MRRGEIGSQFSELNFKSGGRGRSTKKRAIASYTEEFCVASRDAIDHGPGERTEEGECSNFRMRSVCLSRWKKIWLRESRVFFSGRRGQ